MSNVNEILAANERYAAAFGEKGALSHDPARRFAIVTCMDCRLDPAKFAGLLEGMRTSSATRAGASRQM